MPYSDHYGFELTTNDLTAARRPLLRMNIGDTLLACCTCSGPLMARYG
jgi:hypothetical protein